MITALLLMLAAIATYIACRHPAWFWALYVASPMLLEIYGAFDVHFDPAGIPLGPLLLRITDAGNFAMVVGTIVAVRKRGPSIFRGRPVGWLVGIMLGMFTVKVLWTILFGSDVILSNRAASHAAFGLVASLGDLRDNLMAFVLPIYAYATRGSYSLKQLGRPVLATVVLIFIRAAVQIGVTGQIWTDSADIRFISAHEAILLTILCLILFFQGVPGIRVSVTNGIATTGFMVAMVANHRSQWLGALAAIGVIVVVSLSGKAIVGNPKLIRLAFVALLFMAAVIGPIMEGLSSLSKEYPILDVISVRLYALTDPNRDADSKWRETIWADRVRQVGDNWPWGRMLGDRHESLFNGRWITVPDHSAYVSSYELGGVIFCVLMGLFWLDIIRISIMRISRYQTPQELAPPILALTIVAASLGFGTAYDFPWLGPALAVVFTLEGESRSRAELRHTYLQPRHRSLDAPLYVR